MEGIWQDLRYAMRLLAKNPGTAMLTVFLLAIGIGVSSTAFSIADCLLLRSLPVRDPKQIVEIRAERQREHQSVSYREYQEICRQSRSFTGIIASARKAAELSRNGDVEMIRADWVSDNYFSVLGVEPAMGRAFVAAETWDSGDDPPVVISYGLWQRRFGSDPSIVGKRIVINRHNAIVRGVAPAFFGGLQKGLIVTDVWMPVNSWMQSMAAAPQWLDSKDYDLLLGRLHPGIGIQEVRADLNSIAHNLALAYPAQNRGVTYIAFLTENSLFASLVYGTVFLSGPFLILLICCANVSGMVLAQAETRRAEIAARLALGSSRGRLIRQLTLEGIPTALLGAGLGLIFTLWLLELQPALLPPLPFNLRVDLRLDVRVLVFSILASVGALLFSAFLPALHILKGGAARSLNARNERIEGRGLLRNVLVTGQVALSLVLLIATGLFLKSMLVTRQIDPGFDTGKKLLIVNVNPSEWRGSQEKFFLPAIDQIRSLPRVRSATYAGHMILSGSGDGASADVSIPGIIPPEGQKGFRVNFVSVGRDYFQTLGTRIQRGRAFERSDELPDQQNTIISETMAKRFWPKADPIGAYLKVDGSAYQVVGVAQDNRNGGIHRTPAPFIYLPFAKMHEGGGVIIVETVDDPLSFADSVKTRIWAVDKMTGISKPQTLKGIMSVVLYQEKILALFSGALGLLGISLAAIGLYAVVAYLTRCRTREIGIRIALGAQQADVSRMILEDGFKMCLIGIVIGAVIAFFAMRLIGDMLYGVAPTDLWTFAASCLVVLAAALLASYIPARRAARIDPMAALRYE